MRGTLIIFVKAPVAGRVKTRLGRALGPGRAAQLARLMMGQTLAEAAKGPWDVVLAVDPPGAVADGFHRLWTDAFARWPQPAGDLGARMSRALRDAPPGPVVIIGADAPELRARRLRAAFAALRGADAVFGPAADGGYWLVGFSARRRAAAGWGAGVFESVRWSSANALADTRASLPAHWRVALLGEMRDVDTREDLAILGPTALLRSPARLYRPSAAEMEI